jgi:hypothetical protein
MSREIWRLSARMCQTVSPEEAGTARFRLLRAKAASGLKRAGDFR